MEEKTSFSTSQTINYVIGLVVFAVVLFLVFQRVDRGLKLKASHDCMTVARFEKTDPEENSKATYPIKDQYGKCMKEKGY